MARRTLGARRLASAVQRPPDISGPEDIAFRTAIPGELGYRDSYGIAQCPLQYPMHCHMEPSQTANGGNYPGGLVPTGRSPVTLIVISATQGSIATRRRNS